MAVGETAQLAVQLTLDDKLSPKVDQINRRLGAFSGAVNRNLARGIDTGLSLVIRKGFGALNAGLESLRKTEEVTAQTNAVLKSTGNVAGETATDIANLAEKYESLNATIDNKVIQSAENVLLTFTNVRKQAFEPAIQAALDMNQAMGGGEGGLQGTIVQLGKALNDPVKGITALTRVGVTFSDTQKKQIADLIKQNDLLGAQKIILAEVGKEFGGSFAAGGRTAAGAQAALADAIEDVQTSLASDLLPVITNVSQKLTSYLGKPSTLAFFKDLGHTISSLFTDENLDTVASAMQTAASAVGAAIGAFNKLPPEIKALAVGAFAINKVTGGAVTGLAGGLGKLIGGGLSKIFAANVTVIGGNVTGGGGALGAGEAALGGLSLATIGTIVAAAAASTYAFINTYHGPQAMGAYTPTIGSAFTATAPTGGAQSIAKILGDVYGFSPVGSAVGETRDMDKLVTATDNAASASREVAASMKNPAWLAELKKGWQDFGKVTRAQVALARGDITKGTNVAAAAAFIGSAKGPGAGGANVIQAEIRELKAALLKTYDPTETRAISRAIHQLRDKLPAASERAKILHHAEQTATSTESTARKLRSLEKDLSKVESPGLRRKISDLIGEIKKESPKADHRSNNVRDKVNDAGRKVDQTRQSVNATRDAARRAGQTTTAATNNAKSAIVAAIANAASRVPIVNLFVTASTVEKSITYQNRQGPGNGSAGGGRTGGHGGTIPS